jgi:hypothetical protein
MTDYRWPARKPKIAPLPRRAAANLIHENSKALRTTLCASPNLDRQSRSSPSCRGDPLICSASPQKVARVAAPPLESRSELRITPDDCMHTFMLLCPRIYCRSDCPTSKMSHARSWRAACLITITNPLLHFDITSKARGVTAVGVGSGALLGFCGFEHIRDKCANHAFDNLMLPDLRGETLRNAILAPAANHLCTPTPPRDVARVAGASLRKERRDSNYLGRSHTALYSPGI